MTRRCTRARRSGRTGRAWWAGTAAVVVILASVAVFVMSSDGDDPPLRWVEGSRLGTGEPGSPVGSDGHLISARSSGAPQAFEAFDGATMAAVDLTGNGVKEIIAHNDNNRMYVFDGASGALLAELDTPRPAAWAARELAGPAVGDLTGDGSLELVVANSAGWVTAFQVVDHEDGPQFVRLWEKHLDPREQDPDYIRNMAYGHWPGYPGLDGPATLADATGDGRAEVFVQLDDMPSLFKLDPDGEVAWWGNFSDGNAPPVVADLTGDGRQEVIYASDGGHIHVLDARTMHYRCAFDAAKHGVWPGSISVAPTVVDVNGDGRQEMVFGVRNVAEDARAGKEPEDGWIARSQAHYFAVDADCEVLWQSTWDWGNPHVHMSPAPVDITGDGLPDLVFHDWNTIGQRPGEWEGTGHANLFAVSGATGELLWRVETDTYWSNKDVAIADVTGDGEPEILVNQDHHGRDGLGLYSLQGQGKGFLAAPEGWIVTRAPLVADLDGNGRLDIVLPVHREADGCGRPLDVGCREGALMVYHTLSEATAKRSNNHVFNPDLDPDAPRTAKGGAFEPVVASVSGDAWWVEVDLRADRPVAMVEARVDEGEWVGLHLTERLNWARSIDADGGLVEFRITAASGETAVVGPYPWPP